VEKNTQMHDPESNLALEEIVRRKHEMLIQEKLEKVMTAAKENGSSYQLDEREKTLIEIEKMQVKKKERVNF